jgi:ATP-dependent exoDNAse (exonuclease V) beta subunit
MSSAEQAIVMGAEQPSDQRVRERIRTDLGTTLIIEAAAGTGKTTALVSRIVAVIASGCATLDRVVAVTFTEKAAGELKLRLRAEIELARHDLTRFDAIGRDRLTAALEKLEEAHIGTIHSFCADLIRERPVEARVDPMFEVAPEEMANALFDAAFERWFQATLAAPGEGVRRVLRRRDLADRNGPRPILRDAAEKLLDWRDFAAPWQHEAFERERAVDDLITTILAHEELAAEADPDDWLRKAFETIARPLREAIRLEGVQPRDYDALEDTLIRLLRGNPRHWNWKGSGDRFGQISRTDALARRDELKRRIEEFRELAGANLAPLLRDEVWPVVKYYDDLKRRTGRLDFLDLLLIARDLVRDNAAVRAELQERFTHIFVDEFQDTDPLQAEILMLLASDDPSATDWLTVTPRPGKLFIVGDPKQSIYRFRRADVALYQSVKRRLLDRGAELEYMTVSFRAAPGIQRMINAAFAPAMAAESESQPAYARLEPYRPEAGPQPEIVALPVPAPYGKYGRITKWQIDESLPDAIAAFVAWLIEKSGWRVTERETPTAPGPIRPRHVCILFRRLNSFGRDVTRPYVRALEARHISHVLVRGGSFNEREEIEALRNALAAIERPDDELCVFATLRGPFFAIADGPLLRYRAACRRLHPFHRPPPDLAPEMAEVTDALDLLRELHRGRNRRPIADTIARLLAATRAHAGIAIWPTGEQALANVMRLMDFARRYEANGGAVSMRGFVDELEARAEREQAGDAPVAEEGTEGVRIMTVHSAKGLEFPIVVMADLTCNETAREAHRYADPIRGLCAQRLAGCAPRELLDHSADEIRRDKEEAVRVLYVAATRARDLLVVPVVGDEEPGRLDSPEAGWLARLAPAIYPEARAARAPLERKPTLCPDFVAQMVGVRPPDARGNSHGVAPGLHRPRIGDHRVVWWDPSILELDGQETMGLRQSRLLEADERHERSERGRLEYESWSGARRTLIEVGSVPSIRVATVTELAAIAEPPELPKAADVLVEEGPRVPGRPHGARFGTLVHATLSRVALDASTDGVASIAAFYARALGATADETAAAAAAVYGALSTPLIRRAATAAEIRRECALAVKLVDGTIAEGIADLAFIETVDGVRQWTVVDFKTDVEIVGRMDEYRRQVGLYTRAIRESSGLAARGVILWI